MKKTILLFISLIVINLNSFSQVAIAKLKFEDAETAYNSGDYTKTITRLAEAEKLFGKINSPILHLRILAQNKLFLQTRENELGFELKKNCSIFLKDYADVEALEEKYKEVYRINENLSDVPSNIEELKLFEDKKNKDYQDGKKKYFEIIEKYIEARGGKDKLNNVKSIEKITQEDPIGYLDLNGQKIILKIAKHTLRIKDKERAFYEIKGQGFPTTTVSATPGKVKWVSRGAIIQSDEILIKNWDDRLIIFPELIPLTENDSVYYEEQINQGNKVHLLTKKNKYAITKMAFDENTGLKIYEISKGYSSNNLYQESDLQIKSYKEFDGIKFPDLILVKYIHTSAKSQADIQMLDVFSKSMLNNTKWAGARIVSSDHNNASATTDGSKLNKEIHSYNRKIISIKINPEFRDKDLE